MIVGTPGGQVVMVLELVAVELIGVLLVAGQVGGGRVFGKIVGHSSVDGLGL